MGSKFFEELSRCLGKEQIESLSKEDRRLEIFLHGQPVLSVSPGNEVFMLPSGSKNPEANELYHRVAIAADRVFEYVEAMENTPLLRARGLDNKFHLLADFGGAVLAGRERGTGRGYEFVTWIWDYERVGVSHGHYYEDDFAGAKRDFAVRSGLIPKASLFSNEELTEIYLQQTVTAEANLQDVVTLVSTMHRNREPLLHCAVFLELTASSYDALKLLQTDVLTELVRSKLNVDRLLLRQREGFVSVMPSGWNHFGEQFERVLPASSVANLYPFNYSGKTDPHGFYIGKDKYGANILVDFDKRDDDKTSASILILGNSGQGKSYLLKLLLLNFLEAGKSVISLDVEHEQQDMCERVGGCFMDLMGGVYRINPLEPKCWDEGGDPEDTDAPEAFRKSTRLSQHISFLKDFFRAYKDFSDRHIDAIEIMVSRLYEKWGISDTTDFGRLKPEDYPILSDLYDLIEEEYQGYDADAHQLYTAELLQEILLGLHSMCKGAEAKFFNGHTNVTSSRFIVFGVKGLLQANRSVRGAMLFNILSFMSDRLLTIGNTTAVLDELYVWLSDNITVGTTIIEYIRNILKRVRKKESNLIMASQNLEDFDREGIRELTKPLFAIPPHQFIFNCGSIDKRFYMDLLQLEEAEYNLIRFPQRGVCLFKCGNERYLLEVHAPAYKEALYGSAGGR